MNETLKTLKERRSCRKYQTKQVETDVLDLILEAGTYAPTGMNRQAPVIVAVQDKETRDKIAKMNAAVMGSENDPFYGAPTVLVVLADPAVRTYVYDGALVMGNLMNAAHAVGVDSCYIFRAREVFGWTIWVGKSRLTIPACRCWKLSQRTILPLSLPPPATISFGMPLCPCSITSPERALMPDGNATATRMHRKLVTYSM